jgi:hypothetical protein
LKYILGALILLEVADGVVTNILIKKDIAQEGNPVLVNVAGGTGFLIIKIVGVLLAALILWDIRRRHPRLAFWTASVFLLVYIGIVVWNLHLLVWGMSI